MKRHTQSSRVPVRLAAVLAATSLAAAACGSDGVEVTVGDSVAPPTVSTDVETDSVSVEAGTGGRRRLESVIDGVAALPDGWFEMAGYGTVLHVDGDEILPHHVTASTCVLSDGFDNALDVDHVADDGAVITLDVVGPTTDYRLLPLAGPLDCTSLPADSLTALHEAFSTHYPFFDEREIDWNEAFAEFEAASDGHHGIRTVLVDFMVELGDGHTTLDEVSIDPDPANFAMPEVTTIDQVADAMSAELDATLGRLRNLRTDPTGNVGWGIVDGVGGGDVGYLFIGGFAGLAREDEAVEDRAALIDALDAAISDLSEEVEHLIVDVRFNAGGYEDLAVLAAGYFVGETAPAYRKWAYAQPDPFVQVVDVTPQSVAFDGDVVVLTSPVTASAAEAFTMAMVEVADATVIGNPSFGELSDAIDWRLPNGIEFTMSMEIYTDLDGVNHEARGIPVDIDAPFDEAIDTALQHLG